MLILYDISLYGFYCNIIIDIPWKITGLYHMYRHTCKTDNGTQKSILYIYITDSVCWRRLGLVCVCLPFILRDTTKHIIGVQTSFAPEGTKAGVTQRITTQHTSPVPWAQSPPAVTCHAHTVCAKALPLAWTSLLVKMQCRHMVLEL